MQDFLYLANHLVAGPGQRRNNGRCSFRLGWNLRFGFWFGIWNLESGIGNWGQAAITSLQTKKLAGRRSLLNV